MNNETKRVSFTVDYGTRGKTFILAMKMLFASLFLRGPFTFEMDNCELIGDLEES